MAKSIKCSDVGVDCDWGAIAPTEEELMKKIVEHAKEHGFMIYQKSFIAKVTAT